MDLFLLHKRYILGREDYELIEAEDMQDALHVSRESTIGEVLPLYVEIIGPLGRVDDD